MSPQKIPAELPAAESTINVGEPVFYLDDGGTPTQAVVAGTARSGDDQPNVWINYSLRSDKLGTFSKSVPRRNVFTMSDTARLANENGLFPIQPRSEKTLMSTAIGGLVARAETNAELGMLMAGEVIARQLEPSSLRQLGYQTAEELNGAADRVGSNVWRVETMFNEQEDGMTNSLNLSWLDKHERSLLPAQEAATADRMFYDENRTALDTLYDRYGIDYAKAVVYEKFGSDGYTNRSTIYPIAGSNCYFVESALYSPGHPQAPSNVPDHLSASVNSGDPRERYNSANYWRQTDGYQ